MTIDGQMDRTRTCWPDSTETQLRQIVAEALGVDPASINDETSYDRTSQWDSLAHVRLASALEEGFGIEFELDDFAEITSVPAIRTVLIRYGVGACSEACACHATAGSASQETA